MIMEITCRALSDGNVFLDWQNCEKKKKTQFEKRPSWDFSKALLLKQQMKIWLSGKCIVEYFLYCPFCAFQKKTRYNSTTTARGTIFTTTGTSPTTATPTSNTRATGIPWSWIHTPQSFVVDTCSVHDTGLKIQALAKMGHYAVNYFFLSFLSQCLSLSAYLDTNDLVEGGLWYM